MPSAARVGDATSHGGFILPPGESTVLIGGIPAAVTGGTHQCELLPGSGHPTLSPFMSGSPTVLIGGVPALRAGDAAACGAIITQGEPTVMIG